MIQLKGESFDELYRRAFEEVLEGDVVDSRNGMTREILFPTLELTNPRNRVCSLRGRKYNIAFAIAELIWVMQGRGDAGFIEPYNKQMLAYFDDVNKDTRGSYGIRLRKWGSQRGQEPLDQIRSLYLKLMKDTETRQAVMTIWDPALDNQKSRDIPCNNRSNIIIRANRLHWRQDIRSNDLLWGTPYNVFLFTVIQELFASWTGHELGSYVHIPTSLHLYTDMHDEIVKINKHIKERHPFSNDHLFLYDIYKPSVICETFEQTERHMETLVAAMNGMQHLRSLEMVTNMHDRLEKALSDTPFWLNCARVLLAYNTFKQRESNKKYSALAMKIALEIDNDFQFSLLDFMIRRESDLLFKYEDLIHKHAFEEFETRYASYPTIANEVK